MSIGLQDKNLVFLISQPRAGSTLLQRMLVAHPDIYTTSEPWLMLHPLYALREAGIETEYNAGKALGGLREFLSALPEGEQAYWEALRRAFSYLYQRALTTADKGLFLDKTPRYYFIIPELYRLFPKAKFVFLLRNPLAVLASILETWVKDKLQKLSNCRHDLLTAPSCILQGIELLKEQAIVVHYEELVDRPELVLRDLCERLGISFHVEMVEYGRHQAPAKWRYGDQGAAYQHTRPVPELAGQWVEVLSRSQCWWQWAQAYLQCLGPDMVLRMGYSYEELEKTLASIGKRGRIVLVPWHLAIKPRQSRTFLENQRVFALKLVMWLQRSLHHGGVWGTIRQGLHRLVPAARRRSQR